MAAREFSFTSFQANNPTAPPPGDRLDGEFDRLAKTIAALPPLPPAKIGKNQLEPGLFDQIGIAVSSRVEALAASAQALLGQVHAATLGALAAARSASTQNAQAQDAAQLSSAEAHSASSSALAAAQSADQAEAFYVETGNAARDTAGDVATCQAYADVTYAWAEYLPGPIPPNILAVMGITGDHWSSRFWANQAAQIFDAHHVGPPGPTGPTGATGPQGPPGTGSVAGMVAGQIPIAASATGIASSGNLSGDVTSNATLAVTLATVNANVGVFQGLTLDAKGRVTAAVNQSYATAAAMAAADALKAPIASPVFTGSVGVGGAPADKLDVAGNLKLGATANDGAIGFGSGGLATTAGIYVGRNLDSPSGLSIGGYSGIWFHTNDTWNAPGALKAIFDSTNTRNISGAWAVISGAETKQDIEPYTRGLDAILNLNPVQFRYRPGTPFATADEPSQPLFGLIADEVRPFVPEIVGQTTMTVAGKQDVPVDCLEPGLLIFALLNAVKTLEARLAVMEGKP